MAPPFVSFSLMPWPAETVARRSHGTKFGLKGAKLKTAWARAACRTNHGPAAIICWKIHDIGQIRAALMAASAADRDQMISQMSRSQVSARMPKHQVAQDLGVAAHPHVAPAELILEPGINALTL